MNSLIERVKSAMVGLGTGWILALMLILSIVSLAVMLERAWLYWSLRDDIDALMRDLGKLLRGGDMDGARRRLEESRSAEAAVVIAGLVEADRGVGVGDPGKERAPGDIGEIEGSLCGLRKRLDLRSVAWIGPACEKVEGLLPGRRCVAAERLRFHIIEQLAHAA